MFLKLFLFLIFRKKFSQLKEKEPEGAHIKLVPLLLEGWKETYPATTETVKTFQTRIKHLSQQKEIIKKHLGLLRSKTVEKEEEPFRWLNISTCNLDMLKNGESQVKGKFYSRVE
jgi:hypothetical protein